LVGTGSSLWRLLPNGSVNSLFRLSQGLIVAVLLDGDKSLLVNDRAYTNALVRLWPDGSRDLTYRGHTNFYGQTRLLCAAKQPDGRVLVGGGFFLAGGGLSSSNKIVRLLADGSRDPGFTPDPLVGMPTLDFVQVERGGRIVVGCGSATAGRRLARLNPDGSLDPTFDLGGWSGQTVSGLALEVDGAGLLVAGVPSVSNSVPYSSLCRWVSLPHAVLSLGAPGDAGGPRLRVGGLPGQRHRIEYSDDLGGWRSLGVIAGDCMPPCEIELDATAAGHRFYRAVQVP
jgi:hypothetical protein